MRVLVTGGAGFIGSQLVRTLEQASHTVTVLDKLTYAGRHEHLHNTSARLLVGDICDPAAVAAAIKGQDAVIHAAAESHVGRALSAASLFIQVNIEGTRVMLEQSARAGISRFILVSTDEVFGAAPPGRWFTPDAPHRPGNAYAASKSGAEALVHAWRHTHSYPASIVRCTNNYGPRQHPEKAIPWWTRAALAGGPVPVHGDGSPVRDWLYVEDCARGIRAALEQGQPGSCWHLAGQQLRQNRDVVTEVVALCGGAPIEYGPDRPGQDRRYALDDAETRATLGWAPQVPMTTGLAQTVAWYREHSSLWS
jgi:dTDP-glucose 4,6-dehydratase